MIPFPYFPGGLHALIPLVQGLRVVARDERDALDPLLLHQVGVDDGARLIGRDHAQNRVAGRGGVELLGEALGNVIDVAVLAAARRFFAWFFGGTDVVNCDFARGISGGLVGIYGAGSLALG